ncbi:MAG: ABC transporter permease [Bacteroidetes bacterium]|nr:ABC transporter permease [Bacteroidota bacterium]
MMFKNNFKIALRTLKKNKIYTGINLFGLTVGIAAVLLIFRMVSYELSFNKSFKNYDRIVRVVSEIERPSGLSFSVCTPTPAMDVMENTMSQFEKMSRVRELWGSLTIQNPDGGAPLKKFGTTGGETAFFIETAFFDIFDFDWLAGDSKSALNEPHSIVLTKNWAEKCFDNWEDAIGKTVNLDNLYPLTVKGIIEDLPTNIDFSFPFLVSYQTIKTDPNYFFYSSNWGSCSSNDQVYALLHSKDQFDAANESIAKVGDEEYNKDDRGRKRYHVLQPISDLHFNEEYGTSGRHRTSKSRLKVLGFIGLLIMIMACFNFINLATAQSMLRAKEVGVRKTLGGRRGQLVNQFMTETGLIVLISVLLGANLAVISAPLLKYVSDVPDSEPFLSQPIIWGFLGLTTLIVTALAGLYPSLTLANFKPVRALNNNVSKSTFGGAMIRKSLVVLQFGIAQALIIGAIITLMQLDFIRNKDLGFNQDLIYTFNFNSDSSTIARQTALKEKLLQLPSIQTVSFSSDQPFSGNNWSTNWKYGTSPEDADFHINLKFCDANYQEAYGIRMLAGKWLEHSDTMKQAIVNMTTLSRLGINDPKDAIGQIVRLGGRQPLQLVGVTEDFHTHDLREQFQPHLMTTRKDYYFEAGVKINPENPEKSIAAIQRVFDEVLPEQIFSGGYLDENIAAFYQNDNRLASACKGFGFLAILISCLGLFGLATHAAAQRIKEIGIRKVLGASTAGIINLLSKDFLKLVLLALLFASPLAYFFMNDWLNDFVFRIDIGWWVFIAAGISAIVIAFITVSYQAVRAALMNPVKALRDD